MNVLCTSDRPNFGIVENQPNFRPFFVRNFCESSAEPNSADPWLYSRGFYYLYTHKTYHVNIILNKYISFKKFKKKKQLVSTVEHTNSKLRSPKIEGKNQEKSFEKY